MTTRFACVHGHQLHSGVEVTGKQKLMCPLCGSITPVHSPVPGEVPAKPDSLGITMVPVSMADSKSVDESAWRARRPNDQGSVDSQEADLNTTDYVESGSNVPGFSAGGRFAGRSRVDEQSGPSESLKSPALPGYEVMEELGRGGMGVVYLAYDERRGREVALKTLQRMSPDDLVRFKQEFRALADIAHPNLASLYELLSDGRTWCFTMELLKGVEFLDYIWSEFDALKDDNQGTMLAEPPGEPPRLTRRRTNRLYDAIKQLAVGLHELHRAGKLHSDIKPSNVLMTTEGRLVLVDFGLIAEINRDDRGRVPNVIQGTPHYMSPEQAACKPLSAASDWYAVGVMLYELLTGRLPFRDKPVKIMLRKQYETPVEPRQRQPGVPDELNDLCMALLDLDPEKRPTAIDILRAVDAGEEADRLLETAPTAAVIQVELVGRESQLQVLNEALSQVSAGTTRSIFVHGRSGMGKSVLIRTFLDSISESQRAVVLEGRCYEQESVPFKALDSLIDALVTYLGTLPHDLVQSVVPEDSLPLTRLFPVMGQVHGAAEPTKPSVESADQQELRQRALDGLRQLLARLCEHQPLLLYIDDLQWGDEDSSELLADLVRPPDSPHLLLLGSYRREDVDTSSSLIALRDAFARGRDQPRRDELPVDALSQNDAGRLAWQLLGATGSQTMADRIAQESGGSPFFVWELAQHVQDDTTAHLGSLGLDEVIWSRVRRLPDATRKLLEVFAVAGRPMRASEAYQAIDEVTHGPSLLAQLRTANFIRTTDQEADTVVETYHDRIRESVVNHLANAKVRGHHLKIALVIEQASDLRLSEVEDHIRRTADYEEPSETLSLDKQQWQRVFDLSYFFDAAGKSERAFPYALVAARQAWSQNALEVAEQQYEIAKRGAETAGDPLRFRVFEGLSDVLMMRGQYARADQQLQSARALAEEHHTLARIDGKRGYLCFKKGEMENSARHFQRALSELGNPPPANIVAQALALSKECVVQLLHTYMPGWFTARRAAGSKTCETDLFRARLYDGLGYPYWFTKGPVHMLWTHLRHMNLAERYPTSQEMGRAYAMHAVTMTAIPLARRGADYAEKAYHIHGDLGDRLGQGKARSFQTFSLLALGRFEEGVRTGREAVRLLEQAGDVWEANMARIIVSQPLYFLGQLEAAHCETKRAYEIGKETGDHSAMAIALYFWVPSAPNCLPDGALQDEMDRPREDPLSSAAAIQGRGLELLLREDRPREAADVLQQSLDAARQRRLRNPAIFCGVTWKATALRAVAEREPPGPSRKQAIAAARRAVRQALRITRSYLSCRARALRERGLLAVLEGRQDARSYFQASLDVAEQQQARYELAQTRLAMGKAGQQFGWPDADQLVADAKATIAKLEGFRA